MPDHPYVLIVVVSSLLGLATGFVMHRADFCMAGMFRDLFLFRRTFMLRILLMLIVVSMVLFEGARLLGLLSPYPFPLLGPASLANVLGGVAFGIGMVLAGGCVVGTLYKMGAGSALSATAFLGLIIGSALYAELFPYWSSLAQATTVFAGRVTLPEIMGIAPTPLVAAAALWGMLLLYRWQRTAGWWRPVLAEGYLQPWKAALLLALIGLLSYVFIGMPIGITTAYAKLGAQLEQLVAADRVAQLAYFGTQPLSYRPPFSSVVATGGPGPELDAIAAIQFPLILGIVLGAAVSALLLREFHIYVRLPLKQYLSALIGGMIMGMGARMTPACNIWHLLGGLPILAAQSLLFLAGLLPGAWLGSRILAGLVLRPSLRRPRTQPIPVS